MFLPTTSEEIRQLGWDRPDIILVTGDAYIDSPHMGIAVIGKYLLKHGFKTAVIAQPSVEHSTDIERLGEPRLFWGVSGGSIDSMVANYTVAKKFRRQDDYTPGGINIRPNRAVISYTGLIRRFFKSTSPIVLGGIEASLRRIAHYDYWDNKVRRSILFDAKADILAYGMAEKTVADLAQALAQGKDWRHIPGLCYISKAAPENFLLLPSFETVSTDKSAFMQMAKTFHQKAQNSSTGMAQQHGDRFLIHNPSHPVLSPAELDEIYALDFEDDAHPFYKTGGIRALDTIRQSITTHRGCFGQCRFCAISVHQGSTVVSRSKKSIIDEATRLSLKPGFNGILNDVGGPTANMYGATCQKGWACSTRHCLIPRICPNLKFGHDKQIELLRQIRRIPGVTKAFIASGIRPDLVMADKAEGKHYIEELVKYHVSGQIKLAPEHSERQVLALMNKPSTDSLVAFKEQFDKACAHFGKQYFMTYYLIAAHPGCTIAHMSKLKEFLSTGLKTIPEQVQVFTPTPSTLSTAMYYCEMDLKGSSVFCEKTLRGMQDQKDALKTGQKMGTNTSRKSSKTGPSSASRSSTLPSRPRSSRRRR